MKGVKLKLIFAVITAACGLLILFHVGTASVEAGVGLVSAALGIAV